MNKFTTQIARCLSFGLLLAFAACTPSHPEASSGPEATGAKPAILTQGHPRSYFFRYPEAFAIADMPYDKWEQTCSRLMGIEGKVMQEELISMPDRALDYFRRYKQAHPDHLVLIHFNGRDMDPAFRDARFFAGHWLYNAGTQSQQALLATDSITTVKVADVSVFLRETSFTYDQDDDIGICVLDETGRPDWYQSEQVKLLAIDSVAGTITIRRGQYGTQARAFPAGNTYLAAHSWGGPWGHVGQNNLLWMYNFSTAGPKDSLGRGCAEVLAEVVGEYFAAEGVLSDFDGIQFDMLSFDPLEQDPRMADCDADGRGDDGWVSGVNTYGAGVQVFCEQVRGKLGPNRIIQGDGQDVNNQRAIRHLNGMEAEGWPVLWDHETKTWSSGVNSLRFWSQFSFKPSFNYLNQKYVGPGALEMPFAMHRLIMAAGASLDGVLTYSYFPEKTNTGLAALYEEGSQARVAQMTPAELLPIWDEYVGGTAQQPGWLGQPTGPLMRLGVSSEDQLAGGAWQQQLRAAEAELTPQGDGLLIQPKDDTARYVEFHLDGLTQAQPDMLLRLTLRSPVPRRGYPAGTPRMIWCRPEGEPFDRAWDLRSLFWEETFTADFYFRAASPGLTFRFEGPEPLLIEHVELYRAPDVLLRSFEHGLVIANPADHAATIDLGVLFPGQTFRKLQGSPRQDPAFNDGSPLPQVLSVAPRSGVFAWRVDPAGGTGQ
jgi:hypothetical protein